VRIDSCPDKAGADLFYLMRNDDVHQSSGLRL
jgi:hypothetical protein